MGHGTGELEGTQRKLSRGREALKGTLARLGYSHCAASGHQILGNGTIRNNEYFHFSSMSNGCTASKAQAKIMIIFLLCGRGLCAIAHRTVPWPSLASDRPIPAAAQLSPFSSSAVHTSILNLKGPAASLGAEVATKIRMHLAGFPQPPSFKAVFFALWLLL